MSLQASHGNSAVQELLSPVQRVPAVVTHLPHHAPAKHGPAHHASAKARPRIENPTYARASKYVEKYFRREGEKATVLAELKDHAVGRFKEVTGEAFNTQAPSGLEILWGVLQIVPTAGPLLKTCGELKDGAKFFIAIKEAAEMAEQVKKGTEVVEPLAKGYELTKKGSEATEKHEGAAFVIEKINNLDELRVADVAARWKKEDVVDQELDKHEFAPASVDLLSQIQQQLPMEDTSDLEKAADEVRTKFELALYADFYRKSAKYCIMRGGFIRAEFIDGIPDEAKKYIMKLGQFTSEAELASAFRLPIWRDTMTRESPSGETA